MSRYTVTDAAKDTGESESGVRSTWHDVREDARACGELTDRPATDAGRNATLEPNLSEKPYSDFPQPKK